MRITMWTGIALLLAASAGLTRSAQAKTIPIVGKDKVEGACNDAGGTFGTNKKYGGYTCLNKDGSGTTCGGWSKAQKKTCDTWGPLAEAEKQPPRVKAAMAQGKALAKAKPMQ